MTSVPLEGLVTGRGEPVPSPASWIRGRVILRELGRFTCTAEATFIMKTLEYRKLS